MFGSTVLAVVLGLFFVYFVFSLTCSKINEVVAARLQWRADTMEKWLRKSLDPPEATASAISASAFKNSSAVTSLAPAGAKRGLPSYLPPRAFSLAVLDLLAPGDAQVGTVGEVKQALAALPAGHPAKASLTRLAIEAGDDLAAFRTGVEAWFNDSMGRVSGWYKRRVQRWMLVYAAVLTVVLNVDTLMIARTLWNQDTVREAVVAQAKGQPGDLDKVTTDLADVKLNLPIGWAPERKVHKANDDPRRWPGRDIGGLFAKLVGLGITVAALSLGAPFWFDLLNRIARLRSTGDRPETTPPPPPSATPAPVVVVQSGAVQSGPARPAAVNGGGPFAGPNGAAATNRPVTTGP